MANIDSPQGFQIAKDFVSDSNPTPIEYKVDVTNSTSIGRGDIVNLLADGSVEPMAAPTEGIAAGVVSGIFAENGNPIGLLPALTAGLVTIYPLPNTIFEAQTASGTVVNENAINALIDPIAGAVDASTGRSTFQLDPTTIGTGTIFRILGKSKVANNEFGEETVKLLVVSFGNAFYTNTSI